MTFCPQCGRRLEERMVEEEGRVRRVCPSCRYIHYLNPKVVAGAIPQKDGKVILLRRSIEPARGKWTFPAGYVELGESVSEAAIRETKEEVGLDIEIASLLNVYSYPDSGIVTVVYTAHVMGGKLEKGSEAEEVAAFSLHEIPWEELAFRSTEEALREWARTRPAPPPEIER
ncbi:MAG: NUDIX hydrolase [Candidatus Methylomirabilales bacterium]